MPLNFIVLNHASVQDYGGTGFWSRCPPHRSAEKRCRWSATRTTFLEHCFLLNFLCIHKRSSFARPLPSACRYYSTRPILFPCSIWAVRLQHKVRSRGASINDVLQKSGVPPRNCGRRCRKLSLVSQAEARSADAIVGEIIPEAISIAFRTLEARL